MPALGGAAASGLILTLANPPVDAGPLAFVALLPILWVLRSASPRRGFLLGFAMGLVYYGILLSWILPFGFVAWLPLVLVQSLFPAFFGALAPRLWRAGRPLLSATTWAALWTAIDWARGAWPLGGFTWGGLGYTQHENPLLLPLAPITGVWGITFAVVIVNALLLEAALRARSSHRRAAIPAAVAVAVLLAPAVLTFLEEPPPAPAGQRTLDVAVVQGNVPRSLADDRYLQSDVVAQNHIRVHRLLAADPPDLAVWPENSLDRDPVRDPLLGSQVVRSIAEVGAPTLVGAITGAPGGRFYNQVLYYSPAGEIQGRYTKNHLVPFGEYVPFRRVLGWVDELRAVPRDLVPGDGLRLFDVDGVRVATPICFENVFPDLFRRFVKQGAEVVVLTTNDSSYALSPASREHVVMSQLRAAETRRWIVQAAISGISAVVDPEGRVVEETELFRQRILRREIPASTVQTIYTRLGDWFPYACIAGALVALLATALAGRRGRRRDPVSQPPAGERSSGAAKGAAGPRAPQPIAGGSDPRVLVVMPTYNERPTIAEVIEGVLAVGPRIDVLVVDDASPDGTAEVVRRLGGGEPRVRLLQRRGKQGLASAYVEGFRLGLAGPYDVLVEMDADLSHRPEDLPGILEGSNRYDLTVGSRYVAGGEVSNWSRLRLGLSKAGNRYARMMLGLPLSDATSGFRAYRRHVLQRLLEGGITSDGYAFQIELAYRAWQAGFAVGEVPISFREREHGRSKISRRIVVEALWRVMVWSVRDRVRHRRRPSPHLGAGDGQPGRPS